MQHETKQHLTPYYWQANNIGETYRHYNDIGLTAVDVILIPLEACNDGG